MVKHTPGPWDYDMGDFSIYALNDGMPIAAIDNQQHGNEADAQLIAAAPELLASLKETRTALAAAMHAMDVSVAAVFVQNLASAGVADGVGVRAQVAINKAEGRS